MKAQVAYSDKDSSPNESAQISLHGQHGCIQFCTNIKKIPHAMCKSQIAYYTRYLNK